MLGNLEQMLMLAILRVGRNAYGVMIAEEIEERTGRVVMLATIHKTLARLEEKELVQSSVGEPTPVRGGRAKRYYRLTAAGRSELIGAVEAVRSLTMGVDLKRSHA
jgi:PadR family transcriptional regulator, regulatory protein PadR